MRKTHHQDSHGTMIAGALGHSLIPRSKLYIGIKSNLERAEQFLKF